MKSRRHKYGLIGVAVALLAIVLITGFAIAAGGAQPANKVVAAGDRTSVSAPGENVTLLTATMKTSKPTDLMIQAAAECSIFTRIVTNNSHTTSTAGSRALVWVEFDGKVVPIQSTSEPPQDPAAQPSGTPEDDGAVFCDREYSRTVEDQETNTPPDGVDQEDDYIRTKSAHAFNWVRMNTGSGQHTIALKARLTKTTDNEASQATLEIKNRTLIVEPTKMANDAIIGTTGTN